MQLWWIMIELQKGNRRKRTEKEKAENFCFKEEKKERRRKRRKMSEDGKTGAMQLLWIMIASRVGR